MGEAILWLRWPRGHWRKRGLWPAVLTIFGLLALPVAGAQADATWTGASARPEWSDATNWTGQPPGSNRSSGTLTFPTLPGCAAPMTCYTSHNALPGVSATGLIFSNNTGQYRILGSSLTLGSGGISATGGGGAGTLISAPIVLSSSQTWRVGSSTAGYDALTTTAGVTGSSADALTVTSPNAHQADLFVDSDMEVGPVTVNGAGGFHIGGPTMPGSVNGNNGEPVTINGATLVANPGSTAGPLNLKSGALLLGTTPQNNGTTTLHVNGAATLGPSTTTRTFVNGNGSSPGTAFSQLSASGNISLGGQLIVGQGPSNGTCVALNRGDVATLITTSGTLSGTFANAPEGAVLTMASSCQSTAPKFQIHYTSNSVTATMVSGTTPPPPTKGTGRLVGPGGLLMVAGRTIRMPERCQSSVPCRGRFSLTATVRAGKHKKLTTGRCASASFRIRAHRSTTIPVRLRAACLRLLRAQHNHRLSALYASQSKTGQAGQRKWITLVLAQPRRRR